MIPCIGNEGLRIFGATADQRLSLGEDLFLRTHLPIQTNRFLLNGKSENWTQENILDYLKQDAGHFGNRVIILYGAAGSGKSELMAWLNIQLKKTLSDVVVVRVSRTELDIFSIIESFKYWLTGTYFSETSHQRWEEMRRKPRTFAKILVLRVLERLLKDDELIHALYYSLIDLVEPRMGEILNHLNPEKQYLDVLTKEDFQNFQEMSAIEIPFSYESLCSALIEELRAYLLENLSLKETLAAISKNLREKGQRPILLVDDLVQSINVFAAELLDYFITLDEGNWDVILGLTPDAFTHSQHYQDLYQRISYLDTFDDRVMKLWLSDETGGESYFLNEDNLVVFAHSYLSVYRELNEVVCSNCGMLKRCQKLQGAAPVLSPFNVALLIRLFRGLAAGKGRVRHFLLLLGKILAEARDIKSFLEALELYSSNQTAAEAESPVVASIARWYASLEPSEKEIILNPEILSFWGLEHENPLVRLQTLNIASKESEIPTKELSLNPHYAAVDSWLQGNESNRQLLIPLRKGMAKWLRSLGSGEYVYRHGIASPNRLLRYRRLELETSPPIVVEDMDDYQGLSLERKIGHVAFLFLDFNDTSKTVSDMAAQSLVKDTRALALIWQSEDFHHEKQAQIQEQLGLNFEKLALYAYLVFTTIKGQNPLPMGIPEALWEEMQAAQQQGLQLFSNKDKVLSTMLELSLKLFNDFYKLRRNLYDGFSIQRILQQVSFMDILESLSRLEAPALGVDYRINQLEFTEFIRQLASYAQKFSNYLNAPQKASPFDTMCEQLKQGRSISLQEYSLAELELLAVYEPSLFQKLKLVLEQ
jgi:hypothetical protein